MDDQQINPVSPQPPEPPKNLGWIKWVFIIILAAILSSCGTYLVLKSQNQTPPPAEVSTKASPTPTPDPTANWKTYINTEYGYSIKYPDGVEIAKDFDNGDVVFGKKEDIGRGVEGYPLTNMQILFRGEPGEDPNMITELDPKCDTEEGKKIPTSCVTTQPIQINNAVGVQTLSGFSGFNYFVTDTNKKSPVVRIAIASDAPDKDLSVYQKMLSTFRFD